MDYYVPKNKKELIIWIKQRYFAIGQTVAGLERLPKKNLYAIYYQLIKNIKEPVQS